MNFNITFSNITLKFDDTLHMDIMEGKFNTGYILTIIVTIIIISILIIYCLNKLLKRNIPQAADAEYVLSTEGVYIIDTLESELEEKDDLEIGEITEDATDIISDPILCAAICLEIRNDSCVEIIPLVCRIII